jgi:hypothetical protein
VSRPRGRDAERVVWVRGPSTPATKGMAGVLAVAAGAVVGGTVYYFARMFLDREVLPLGPPESEEERG